MLRHCTDAVIVLINIHAVYALIRISAHQMLMPKRLMSACVWEGAGLHPDKSALFVKKIRAGHDCRNSSRLTEHLLSLIKCTSGF